MTSHLKKILIFTFISCISNVNLQSKDSLSLYLFLLDECRISQEMTPHIRDIFQEFNKQIEIIAVFPNESSTDAGIKSFVSKHKLKMKAMTDYAKSLATLTGATILPEAVIYNHTTNKVLYRGRINDLYTAPGRRKHHIGRHDLQLALTEILNQSKTPVQFTQAIGCLIDYSENLSLPENISHHE